MKNLHLCEIFTDDQLRTAELCLSVEELHDHVVEPNIEAINKRVGQENCSRFLSYMLAAALHPHGWPFAREGRA